jgi:hypothetical protein
MVISTTLCNSDITLLLDIAIAGHGVEDVVDAHLAGMDAADQHAAEVLIVLEVRDEHREGLVRIGTRRRNCLESAYY